MDEARVKAAINTRIALYRAKQAKRDPFGDDMCNSYELCNYHVEVLQWLAGDLGIEVIDPAPHDSDSDTLPKGFVRSKGSAVRSNRPHSIRDRA